MSIEKSNRIVCKFFEMLVGEEPTYGECKEALKTINLLLENKIENAVFAVVDKGASTGTSITGAKVILPDTGRRFEALEKKIAALEAQIQELPKKIEDDNLKKLKDFSDTLRNRVFPLSP